MKKKNNLTTTCKKDIKRMNLLLEYLTLVISFCSVSPIHWPVNTSILSKSVCSSFCWIFQNLSVSSNKDSSVSSICWLKLFMKTSWKEFKICHDTEKKADHLVKDFWLAFKCQLIIHSCDFQVCIFWFNTPHSTFWQNVCIWVLIYGSRYATAA